MPEFFIYLLLILLLFFSFAFTLMQNSLISPALKMASKVEYLTHCVLGVLYTAEQVSFIHYI